MVAAATVFGILGICVALILFLSPIPTIRRVLRDRTSSSFSQLPFVMQIVESSYWSLWAIAVGERLEMLVNNIIGITFMATYVIIFSCYVPQEKKRITTLHLLVSVILVASGFIILFAFEKETASLILSVAAVVLNIVKYASPLSVARMVIQTQSVEFLPLPLTTACLLCSIFWVRPPSPLA